MNQRCLLLAKILTMLLLSATAGAPSWAESVRVNGFEIYYEIVGEGEPLILLHGGSGSGAGMKTRYADLSTEFQMIIPDLRGHGRSPDPTGDLSPRQAALDVFALLDYLQLHQVKAFGGSYGAAILLQMAIQQPDRIEAMVLGAAGAQISEQGRDIMRASDRRELPPPALQRMRQTHIEGDEQIDALMARFAELADDYEEFSISESQLSTISARTLIVNGDRDELLPAQTALDLYSAIPNSYLWLVPNGAHAVLLTDQTLHEYFVRATVQFLRGNWDSAEGSGPGAESVR